MFKEEVSMWSFDFSVVSVQGYSLPQDVELCSKHDTHFRVAFANNMSITTIILK